MEQMESANKHKSESEAKDCRILRLSEVARYLKLSKSTIYNLIKAGQFVSQVSLGPRAKGYMLKDIDLWIAARLNSGEVAA